MRTVIFAIGFMCCLTHPLFAQKDGTGNKQSKGATKEQVLTDLEIGSEIPLANMELTPVLAVGSQQHIKLQDQKTKNGLIVMFSCNTCPFVKKAVVHTAEIMAYAREKNIGMVIVNSNEATRHDGESEQDMIDYATKNNYTVPYVIDMGSRLADFFGATHTPEVFLFNGEGKLIYKGAMEDNPSDPDKSSHFYLKEASVLMLENGHYEPQVTKSLGCSIKRK